MSTPTTFTWISGGVAVAVAGVASFALFYGLAGGRYGYLQDHCSTARDAGCDDARTTGKTEELVAYVALGVAAAAAAAVVVSLVSPRSKASTASLARATGPWRLAF